MAEPIEQAWRSNQQADKELQTVLADKSYSLEDINLRLAAYRVNCDTVIFLDLEFAQSKNVEAKLWEAHGKLNSKFRKHLSSFREGGGKRKPVEQRKAMKQYLEFIKSSQRFYRAYIQRLAAHFGGITELEAVAGKFHPDTAHQTAKRVQLPEKLRHAVLLSCHGTLVRLGDLSRYRETELITKERNWSPAIGYYDLAGSIRPSSGASHNQLAVIALADGNHLRATYHLYRALAVNEPHPTAKGNLEIEFKKITAAWDKGELISNSPQKDGPGPGKALLGWFMRLHARCYKGVDFAEHDELENEVLSQLAIDLKERSLEGTLHKFILINIAAEYFARVRLQSSPESTDVLQAFFFFQRLNVKTFFTLLQVLQPELERFVTEESVNQADSTNGSEKITLVARRVLPGLRHYSSWLMSNPALLAADMGDTSLNVQIKELWKIYANTLTLLAATFTVPDLPSIDYLLEEDEDTLGFIPFEKDPNSSRHDIQAHKNRMPKYHDRGIERHHKNVEMLGRVRDFLTDGLELAVQYENIPIDLIDGTTFVYREEGIPSEFFASPEGHHATLSSTSIEREDIAQAKMTAPDADASIVDDRASQSASASISANPAMKRMVDNIVGSEASNEPEYLDFSRPPTAENRAPPTPPSYSFEESTLKEIGNDTSYGVIGTLTARDLVQEMRCYSPQQVRQLGTPRPLIPSVCSSPFPPAAIGSPSRPGTAKPLPVEQQRKEYSLQSSVSSMQDPSSMFTPNNTSWKAGIGNGTAAGVPSAVYGNGATFNEEDFVSPLVFNGSPWASSSKSGFKASVRRTPPNGQDGG